MNYSIVKQSFSFPERVAEIKWNKSASGKSLWATNCDFEGKSVEKNRVKADDCIHLCETEKGNNHSTY